MIAGYFAYGSNMNLERVRDRGLRPSASLAASIHGFALRFDKLGAEAPGAGHANLVHAPGCRTHGVLHCLDDPKAILLMDPFERAPVNYGREAVRVETSLGPHWAWTYFANPAMRAGGLRPTRAYLDHLLAGAPYLPERTIVALRAQVTL